MLVAFAFALWRMGGQAFTRPAREPATLVKTGED
jgi:hypothetical protein